MNVKLASFGTPETRVDAATLLADDRRKKLIITCCTGTVYVNFDTTEPTTSLYDIKLVAGASYTIDNYIGECKALISSGNAVRFVSFK